MPTYAYQAVDGTGKRTRGHAQAASTSALQRSLEERGLFVLDVAESTIDAAPGRRGFRIGRRREVLEVTRALAVAYLDAQRAVAAHHGRQSGPQGHDAMATEALAVGTEVVVIAVESDTKVVVEAATKFWARDSDAVPPPTERK